MAAVLLNMLPLSNPVSATNGDTSPPPALICSTGEPGGGGAAGVSISMSAMLGVAALAREKAMTIWPEAFAVAVNLRVRGGFWAPAAEKLKLASALCPLIAALKG